MYVILHITSNFLYTLNTFSDSFRGKNAKHLLISLIKNDKIITKRFMEGQLDECDLTLKDLTLIKKSFLNILVGIHHQRIKYPEYQKE